MHQEIEQERQLNKIDDTSGETNAYKEFIVNNAEKIEPLVTQMEQWSILSNTLNYKQYDRHPKNCHSLGISAINKYAKNPSTVEESDTSMLDFGQTLDILREEYLDVYEGIQSEILSTTRSTDLSTTYLGKVDRSKIIRLKQKSPSPYQNKGIPWENC